MSVTFKTEVKSPLPEHDTEMNAARSLTIDELKRNFTHWKNKPRTDLVFPVDDFSKRALNVVPTTHTFGWRIGPITALHRKIFFEDKALLSESSRRGKGGDSTRSFVDSTAAGLGFNEFVFTYLSVHEPYYARTNFPAFGIFVRKEAEVFPECIATRRDLVSRDVDPSLLPNLQCLLPSDARELAAIELSQRPHDGNFWHYWGHPDYWKGHDAESHWNWVSEFHFLDSVPISNFQAILWPRETMVSPYARGFVPTPHMADQRTFARQNPDCKIINYNPSTHSKPATAFIAASVKALEHFLEHDEFPDLVS